MVGQQYGDAEALGEREPRRSYATWTFANGSTMLLEAEGYKTLTENGTPAYKGSQVCVAGSGCFADVDCVIDWAHSEQPSDLYAGHYQG